MVRGSPAVAVTGLLGLTTLAFSRAGAVGDAAGAFGFLLLIQGRERRRHRASRAAWTRSLHVAERRCLGSVLCPFKMESPPPGAAARSTTRNRDRRCRTTLTRCL